METNAVSQNSASASSKSLTNSGSLADTFDNFLTLLTTQLQNQDPLSPMDTNQFTEQLVQFTAVEQSLATNDKLDDLIGLQRNSQLNATMSFLGRKVSAESEAVSLNDGSATMTYELGESAAATRVVIIDESGRTVRTLEGETGAGPHELVWDGTDANGNSLPDGTYGFLVSAVDAEEAPISVTQGTVGQVDGIEVDGESIMLSIGGVNVPLDKVRMIHSPDAG